MLLMACGVKEQADQLKAFEKCTYEIVSADSVYVAGTDLSRLINEGSLNLLQAPRIAIAYLQQQMPVKAILMLKITNPGSEEAAINAFEYQVSIKENELLNGFIDKKISVDPNGGSTTIPIKVDRDIYSLLSSNQQAIMDFLTSQAEKTTMVTFRIRPSFLVGSEVIKYPDYITITKELTNTTLLSYIKRSN